MLAGNWEVSLDPIFLALLAAIAVLLLLILVRVFSPRSTSSAQLLDLKNELADLKTRQIESQAQALRAINEHLVRSQGTLNQQLDSTNRAINDVHRKLGSLSETAKNLQEIGKDISSLQEILQAPKLRGNLGEYLLEDLLKQVLPSRNYTIKHSFRNGTQVDAAISLGGSLIPIDSKFPLESFQRIVAAENPADRLRSRREFVRTVKARIDEIAARYINPDEGTFDFALMYVPAENVFYEIIVTDGVTDKTYEIFNYAIQKHVIPVSPNSFYSYLMAIAYGLRGFRIEQQAKTIIGELAKVGDAFTASMGDFDVLGRHIKNAAAKFDDCQKRMDRFGEHVARITGAASLPDDPKGDGGRPTLP
jgi:DNA recombination protein RmuC